MARGRPANSIRANFSLLELSLSGRFEEFFPRISDMSPFDARQLLQPVGTEPRGRTGRRIDRYLTGDGRYQSELAARLREATVDSCETLLKAAMLVAKGERDPDFYTIDPNARGGPNLDLEFPILARTGLDMAYSLRETGELEETAITDIVFRYLARHCCCMHMNSKYNSDKKQSDSAGVVGVRV